MRRTSVTRHLRPEDLAGRRWRGLVRESTERQAEAWSPERQRSDIRRAADELGMVPVEPLFYERVGSGEKESVPELQRALRDGKAGEYDVLVVLTTSRFARNATEARIVKRDFARAGIVIYFAADRIISGSRSGRLTEGIKEVLDEEENEVRRMWVAGGMRERQLSLRWTGRVPYGYRKLLVDFPDGTRGWDGGLDLDPVAASHVRRMYQQLAGGVSAYRIARTLNTVGLRTVTGLPWTGKAIRELVGNPVYKGVLMRYPRAREAHYYSPDDPHDGRRELGRPFPAIVDDRLWAEVQTAHQGKSYRTVYQYPLAGVIRCGACKRKMTGMFSGKHRYYRCKGREVGGCDGRHANAEKAEAAFAEWLDDIRLPPDWRTALSKLEVKGIVADDRERRQKIEERLARIRNLYAWGDMAEPDYLEESARLKEELGLIVMPSVASLELVAAALAEVGKAWRTIPLDRRRELPGRLLHSIIVEDGKVTTFVARPELRPLLELGVVEASSASTRRSNYTVRFSA